MFTKLNLTASVFIGGVWIDDLCPEEVFDLSEKKSNFEILFV